MSAANGLIRAAEQAVDLATEIVRTHPMSQITGKGDRDMASDVDFAVERGVRAFLAEHTPSVGFLGEEEGLSNEARLGMVWALDPIDGTANFVHGLPLCAISLALVEAKRPTLGVIALPYLGTRYSAVEGHGAYSESRRLKVRDTANLTDAIVSIGDYAVGKLADERNRSRLKVTEQLASSVQRVRMLGSAAIDLSWVADGRLDASVTLSNKPWDTAAGVIIAREAGALVIDLNGNAHSTESKETIAVSPGLADELLKILRASIGESVSSPAS